MWTRNILFIGLVLGAAATLSATLSASRSREDDERVARPAPEPLPVVAQVDRELRRQWAEEGLTPAPRAAELTVLRRLSLALTGSIPSLEELRRYEKRPASSRQSEWLDGMLTDRRFTNYFAERFARAFVGTEGGPFLFYRRRRFLTWLSDELMENRPYDRIVREIISGQGLWTDHPSTNFVTVTYDPEKKLPDPERLAARAARAFLGVRIDCAQCHDHPFQPWKQRDFRGIAAFFGQVETGFTGVRDGKGKLELNNRKTGKPETIEPGVPFLPELWTREGTRRAQFARWVTDPKNPNLPRATVNRVWALLFGRPLVEPVDDLPAVADQPAVLGLLADDFVAHGYDLRRLIRSIVATEAFRLDSATAIDVTEAQERAWAVFPLTRLRPEQVVGGLYQAASLATIDQESHVFVRLARSFGEQNFVRRYGDTGEDDFTGGSGTIPQRLLMMNGEIVESKTKDNMFNAAKQVGMLAPTDRAAVDVAYLTVLTRHPSPEESAHFVPRLEGTKGDARSRHMTDLFWTLINSTEFSWNH